MSSLYRFSDEELKKLKKGASMATEAACNELGGDEDWHLVMSWLHDAAGDVSREIQRREVAAKEMRKRMFMELQPMPTMKYKPGEIIHSRDPKDVA